MTIVREQKKRPLRFCKGVWFNASLSYDDRIIVFIGLLVDGKV